MKNTFGRIAVLVLLLPTLGISGALSFRLGYFVPRAQSDLWTIEFENMTFQKSDFQNTTLGIHYEHFLTKEVSLVIGVDSYSQTRLGDYEDLLGYPTDIGDYAFPGNPAYQGAFAITHNFGVSITPIQLSLKLVPLGRRSSFIPYVGGGLSLYVWSAKLLGDTVDFGAGLDIDDPDFGEITIFPIFPTQARAESRFSIGFHGFAGFMIPVASRLAIQAEFKYNLGKGSLGESFEGFEDFDLGGYQISAGVNYWF
jgi:hypothetical protein